MVSVLSSCTVDREFEPWSDQKTIKLVFVASPLFKHTAALRSKNGDWSAPSGMTSLPAYCCFSELAL